MTDEAKVEALKTALDIYAEHLGMDPRRFILMVKMSPPVGRHLHAWCYPGDAFLEGPGGSIVIAFKRDSIEKMDRDYLMPILAHEMIHGRYDIEKIARGERVDEGRAQKEGDALFVQCKPLLQAAGVMEA